MTTHIQLQTSQFKVEIIIIPLPIYQNKNSQIWFEILLRNSEGRGGRVIHKYYVGQIYDVFWVPGDLDASIDQDKWLPNQSLERFTSSILVISPKIYLVWP